MASVGACAGTALAAPVRASAIADMRNMGEKIVICTLSTGRSVWNGNDPCTSPNHQTRVFQPFSARLPRFIDGPCVSGA
jgi:hypothetical protein